MFSKELLINRPKKTKKVFQGTIEVVKGMTSGSSYGYGASNDTMGYPFGSVTLDTEWPPMCYMFYTGVNNSNGTLDKWGTELERYGTIIYFSYDEFGDLIDLGESISVTRLDNGKTMIFTGEEGYYHNEEDFFTLDDVGSTIQFEVIYD